MNKKQVQDALAKVFEDKGKRKFTQSVELIVNFRGIDFTKPENRLNLDIALPKGKGGKEPKIAVIAE
ncbi:MAG: 50S ribosomal protein L1, partial [Candidatus Micrarchaeia archaeon]